MDDQPDDKPAISPLVIGLTRSPTLWGVPYLAVVIVTGVTMIAWLASDTFWALLIAPVCYTILFSLCTWDPKILEVFQVATSKTPRTRNKSFWGANSYGP